LSEQSDEFSNQNRSAMERFFTVFSESHHFNMMFELLNISSDWLYTLGSFAGGGALGGLMLTVTENAVISVN
jgi:hypothetical protein